MTRENIRLGCPVYQTEGTFGSGISGKPWMIDVDLGARIFSHVAIVDNVRKENAVAWANAHTGHTVLHIGIVKIYRQWSSCTCTIHSKVCSMP